jgi:hypothetical protein
MAEPLGRLENCSKLVNLVRKNDLRYVLDGSGLHTLFAPNDQVCTNGVIQVMDHSLLCAAVHQSYYPMATG